MCKWANKIDGANIVKIIEYRIKDNRTGWAKIA
jgi:hypothetical protein